MSADVDDRWRGFVGQGEVRIDGPGSLHEQCDRTVARHVSGQRFVQERRNRKRAQAELMFLAQLQRLLARRQQADLRCRTHQCIDEGRNAVQKMLAVVEHQQKLLVAQRLDEQDRHRAGTVEGDADRLGHRQQSQRRIGDRGQLD